MCVRRFVGLVGLMLLLCPGLATASGSDHLCKKSKLDFVSDLSKKENRIAFRNQGGLFNGGVCWWHSRLQRNSVYLTKYDTRLASPESNREVRRLIRKIKRGLSVVTIPGYANFQAFTSDWEAVTLRELERWQRIDGFVFQRWITGLTGRVHLHGRALENNFRLIKENFNGSFVVPFLKLQMPGVTAHAFLLAQIKEATRSNSSLYVVDSNYPTSSFQVHNYQQLSQNTGTPYVEFVAEQRRIQQTLDQYCGRD